MNLFYLFFIIFFFIFLIDSGKVRPSFDEIFGDGWDKNELEEIVIKIEQNEQNENSQSAVDQMGEEMGNLSNDQTANYQQKRETIKNFEAIKEKLKQKGKYQWKNNNKIERKIGKLLGANIKLIHKWKNELNLNKREIKKRIYEQKKCNFIERFDEFKELYAQGKQKEFVKELGISNITFHRWKKELMPQYQKTKKSYSNEDKFEKMKQYFEIKEANPKMSDRIIAKKLGIGSATLIRWKMECSST